LTKKKQFGSKDNKRFFGFNIAVLIMVFAFVINTDVKGYLRPYPHINPCNISAPPYMESLSPMAPKSFTIYFAYENTSDYEFVGPWDT
jgi:hypothetical protein